MTQSFHASQKMTKLFDNIHHHDTTGSGPSANSQNEEDVPATSLVAIVFLIIPGKQRYCHADDSKERK